MLAITIIPQRPGSARLDEISEPQAADGAVLAQVLQIGVCGTDHEILKGAYGWAPPDRERLVIGHESLARVLEAPVQSGLHEGDLIVGIVRRPDPVPCPSCAVGEWDMCRNSRYTERGIKQRDGFAAERIRLRPEYAVHVDAKLAATGVLLEPASIVAKAWEHIERIGHRFASFAPRRVLVTGAGSIGLLAALMGVQRGHEVHVYDRVVEGIKPELVHSLGATYHAPDLQALDGLAPDLVLECTGAAPVIIDVVNRLAPDGIVCLAGVSSGGHTVTLDIGLLNRELVLENTVVFGAVNANRRHYEQAALALARADPAWLARVISRRVPLAHWQQAFEHHADDVKVVIQFGG
jgi:threonine dehydrogenase-like Zn-dependent dehydrogenase